MENEIKSLLEKSNYSAIIKIFQQASKEERIKIIVVVGAVIGTSVVLKKFYDFLGIPCVRTRSHRHVL